MPSKSFEVQVAPAVMKWARESAGRTIEDTAKRLGVNESLVVDWEKKKKSPTIHQLRELAKYYQRPLDAFLLYEPPIEPSSPQDFRKFSNGRGLNLHSETKFALRKARRLQTIAKELKGPFPKDAFYKIGKVDLSNDPELLAAQFRDFLGIKSQAQVNWRKSDVLKNWVRLIESAGVIVIQISMPIEDARAFSLIGDGYPIIALNRTDFQNGRIFSLFHEIGHILLNKEGICDTSSNPLIQKSKVEKFCNHFAGAFLVPKDDLLDYLQVNSLNNKPEWSEDALRSMAKEFKVSEEVVLRRLLFFDFTSKEFYSQKRKEWAIREEQLQKAKQKKEEERKKEDKQRRGGSNIARDCIQQNGVPIVSLILESYYDNRLNKYDIANYLEVNLKHLPKIEKALWS